MASRARWFFRARRERSGRTEWLRVLSVFCASVLPRHDCIQLTGETHLKRTVTTFTRSAMQYIGPYLAGAAFWLFIGAAAGGGVIPHFKRRRGRVGVPRVAL